VTERKRALPREQAEHRFDTGGLDFEAAVARVIAGGPATGEHVVAEREADK
jgi:hypothetical protein